MKRRMFLIFLAVTLILSTFAVGGCEEEEPPAKEASEDDLGPSAGPVEEGKKPKRSRKKIEKKKKKKKDDMGPIGPEDEEEAAEELMELQPLEPIIEEDSEMEFEEAEELVEEIIEEMESGTEEAEDIEEPLEEGEFRFDSMEDYEKELASTAEQMRPIAREWRRLWPYCTATQYETIEDRYGPNKTALGMTDANAAKWWMFTVRSFQQDFIRRWGVSCRKHYSGLLSRFAAVQRRYDFFYREYQRFAAESGKLSQVQARSLPRPR